MAAGLSITVKLTRVPSPTREETRRRSLLRWMFGRPMPAPKPSARASEVAVEKPSFIARRMSGMPGPSSITLTLTARSLRLASSRPRSAWMTTFISAS